MSVILMRLEGEMQSWGIGSRFDERYTEREPTKSGIMGLIASALGRFREDSVEDLAKLKLMVRVDREGQIVYDFHTTMNVLKASAKGKVTPSKLGNVISRRFYISDACFLIGLEGEDEKLNESILGALRKPKRPLFLGRKSFLPNAPILIQDNLIEEPLIEVMESFPWLGRDGDDPPSSLRLIYETDSVSGSPRLDIPLSFRERTFRNRNVAIKFIPFKLIDREEN